MKNYYSRNKEKLNLQSKKYYLENRDRLLEMQKSWARKRKYGLSDEEFTSLLSRCEGKCQICGNIFSKTPHVDHCHKTGRVRGLLCKTCNTALGFYEKYKNDFERYLNEN